MLRHTLMHRCMHPSKHVVFAPACAVCAQNKGQGGPKGKNKQPPPPAFNPRACMVSHTPAPCPQAPTHTHPLHAQQPCDITRHPPIPQTFAKPAHKKLPPPVPPCSLHLPPCFPSSASPLPSPPPSPPCHPLLQHIPLPSLSRPHPLTLTPFPPSIGELQRSGRVGHGGASAHAVWTVWPGHVGGPVPRPQGHCSGAARLQQGV